MVAENLTRLFLVGYAEILMVQAIFVPAGAVRIIRLPKSPQPGA